MPRTLIDYLYASSCVERKWDDPSHPNIYYRYYRCDDREGFGAYRRLPGGGEELTAWFSGARAREKAKEHGLKAEVR